MAAQVPPAQVPPAVVPPAPYVAPAGMGALTAQTAQDWIGEHLNPTQDQMDHIFNHIYMELNHALGVCRLSDRQKYAVVRQGVTDLDDLTMLGSSVSDIRSILKMFNTLSAARGGVNFGVLHYSRLFALVSFAKDKRRRDQAIVAADFTDAVMREYISKAEAKASTEGEELEIPSPPELKDTNFHKWQQAVNTVLLTKEGTRGIPLAYVIRSETAPDEFEDDTERLIFEASRTGPAWEEDNKNVGNYLTSLLTGTQAESWIKPHVKSQNGRAMMTALRVHYLGQSQKEKIIEDARKKRDGAYYKSQGIYTFEKFSTDLHEAFQALGDYEREVEESEKIRLLREKIGTDNATFNASANAVLYSRDITTFETAVAEISLLVSRYFPSSAMKKGRYGVAQVDVSKFATSSQNGRHYYQGVDITEFTRFYDSKTEWPKLSSELKAAILQEKKEQGITGKKGGGGKAGGKRQPKALTKKVKKMKVQIKALTKQVSEMKKGGGGDDDSEGSKKGSSEATGPNSYAKKKD